MYAASYWMHADIQRRQSRLFTWAVVLVSNASTSSSHSRTTHVRRDDYQMASDKHLDAEWKRIQKKTFTRWCNEHIKVQSIRIDDLSTDLSDGVRLIVLLEVLSQKKLGRYNKKPRVHAQRMENVQLALDFIMKKERIRLVNIGEELFWWAALPRAFSRCVRKGEILY